MIVKELRIKTILKSLAVITLALSTALSPLNGADSDGAWFVSEEPYYLYLEAHTVNNAVSPIEIDVLSYTDAALTVVDGGAALTAEDGFVTYTVDVDTAGLYSLEAEYLPIAGKGINIEKELRINGDVPYFEARYLTLSRVWTDKMSVRENVDSAGNEMRPPQIEVFDWYVSDLVDGSGYYSEPMLFWLERGQQEITIKSVRESAKVRRLRLSPRKAAAPYKSVDAGSAGNSLVAILEAESPSRKSSPMLIPQFDRASPKTSPVSVKEIKLNMLGGSRWKVSGLWVEYDFTVPNDGYYKIGLRARQNMLNGGYSSRKITIDGNLPFREAGVLRVDYSSSWQVVTPMADGEPCLFWLNRGAHTLRLEATLGTITEYLDTVQESLTRLNGAYRDIIMITGPTPDRYRDYYFMREIPQVFECFEQEQAVLKDVKERFAAEVGYSGENLSIFNKIDFLFDVVLKDPADLVKQLNNFKQYIGALATWMLTAREQPLDLDVIYIGEANYQFPKPEAGFFEKIAHELAMFFSSFFSDYNAIRGKVAENRGAITVWTSAARDHVNILRQMIDETFSPQTGIDVNLQLVAGGSLLPSTLAGIGPDVALSVSSQDVMNYAARGAALDLSGFKDIDRIKARFMESALLPMGYEGGFYGVPETQTFPVLFYRKDILSEMGLGIPQNWSDVYAILPELQKKNMTFGLKTGSASFPMFLFQMGGEYYREGGRYSDIASDIGVAALRMQSDMFISYELPQKYDFANRFRTGEMPLGVDDYTMFNLLTVFAPEIKGLWGFSLLPGTVKANGTIDRSAASGVGASIIMSKVKEPELAFEFLDWFSSDETQTRYGRELETILGTAARYNTANVEAIKSSAWHKDEVDTLISQWKWIKGIPEVPGGYYTGRYVDFAFRSVVLQGGLPREVLIDDEDAINEEIAYKRVEFGLNQLR
jgi:ABC-type glycerol-3-phosphate transport system substrate-binding protein